MKVSLVALSVLFSLGQLYHTVASPALSEDLSFNAYAADGASTSCWSTGTQADVPRRSFQWPKFKTGFIPRAADAAKALVIPSNIVFETNTALKRVAQAVYDFQQELATAKSVSSCESRLTPLSKIVVKATASTQLVLKPGLTVNDEGYKLTLQGTQVTIEASTDLGARHGLVSLQNLLELRNCNTHRKFNATSLGSKGSYFVLPYDKIEITDEPRLRHRGLMLDTSRHYLSPELIKRVVRVMARSKMNVFHWHATDDQSFPLVIGNSAKLIHGEAGKSCMTNEEQPCLGAYSNDQTYSQTVVEDILAYADLRGVRVIIEVDMPAHARSWGSAKQIDMVCSKWAYQKSDICLEPICGVLNLKDDASYKNILDLASTILKDIDALKGYNPEEYIHIGMDEVTPGCWGVKDRDVIMMQWLKDIIKAGANLPSKRRLIVWQDAAKDHEHALVPEEARADKTRLTAQVWNDLTVAQALAGHKHDLIWSNYNAMYLDCGRANPAVANLTSWCSPYKSWWDVYAETPDVHFTESQRAHLLGGEVCMWAEQASELTVESLLWPRAAAWAGASWEARTESPMGTLNYEEYIFKPQDNLEEFMLALSRECIPYTPMRTQWCGYGDNLNTDASSRDYCNKFAVGFMTPPPPPTAPAVPDCSTAAPECQTPSPAVPDSTTNGAAGAETGLALFLFICLPQLLCRRLL